MWKVLGKETIYIDVAKTWKERIMELSADDERFEKFEKLMSKTTVAHLFNGSMETHNFMLEVPKKYKPADIQLMADVILDVAKNNLETPFVEVDGIYQKSQVIISNEEEPELLGMNKTEGYSSGKIFMPIMTSLAQPGRPNDNSL